MSRRRRGRRCLPGSNCRPGDSLGSLVEISTQPERPDVRTSMGSCMKLMHIIDWYEYVGILALGAGGEPLWDTLSTLT